MKNETSVPKMAGALNYEHDMELPFSAAQIRLAMIAAPFAAAGATDVDAIRRAWALLLQALEFVHSIELNDSKRQLNEASKLGLREITRRLESTDKRIAQKYLRKVVNDPAERSRIWNDALRGGKPFTRDLVEKMLTAQQEGRLRRGRAAADARLRSKSLDGMP